MTRARMLWLALLSVGFLVALLLHTSGKQRTPSSAPEPRALAPSARSTAVESDEFEIEVADPREVGITPPSAPSAAATDEVELVRTLGALWQSEPERALALAEEGDRRFGDSPRAVERRFYEIKALVKLGRIGSARTRAERYLASYPPGPMTDEVERLTGVHRRPEPEPSP